jgi:hypothetical protein
MMILVMTIKKRKSIQFYFFFKIQTEAEFCIAPFGDLKEFFIANCNELIH